MAESLTFQNLVIASDGSVTLNFSDGTGAEFPNWPAVISWAGGQDAPGGPTRDALRLLIVGWWLAQDPAGADPGLIQGKKITIDFTKPALLAVS